MAEPIAVYMLKNEDLLAYASYNNSSEAEKAIEQLKIQFPAYHFSYVVTCDKTRYIIQGSRTRDTKLDAPVITTNLEGYLSLLKELEKLLMEISEFQLNIELKY